MPQLDSNTFIYQYVGIIVLLALVYYALSYMILPILLRSTLIRTMLLTRAASIKEQTSGALTHVLQLAGAGISSRGLTLFENSVRRVTKTMNVLTNNPDFLLNQTHSVRVSN